MPNKNYIAGRRREYQCKKALLEQGAVEANRTAGSHGSYDVVAHFPDGHTVFVQVKDDTSPLCLDRLRALPISPPDLKQVWWYHDRTLEVISV